jgi:anti-anti-sigma factor
MLGPHVVEEWRLEVTKAVDCPFPVVLDLNGWKFMASLATGALICIERDIRKSGRCLALCAVHPAIHECLRITRLDRLFPIYADLGAAVASVKLAETRIGCPVAECGGLVTFNGPVPLGRVVECPECRSQFTVAVEGTPGVGAMIAVAIDVPTYEKEGVRIRYDVSARTFTVLTEGRLDLFASESFETAWRTIPSPNNIVLDLSGATSVSEPGVNALLRMLLETPNGSSTTVRLGSGQEELAADLRGRVSAGVGDDFTRGCCRTIPLEMAKPIIVEPA